MPENTFDIVSKIDLTEVSNAIQQALKEVHTRFDLKDSKSNIELEKDAIVLHSADEYKLKAVNDILQQKLVKRDVYKRQAIIIAAHRTIHDVGKLFDQFQFSRALEAVWTLIAAVDRYIVENKPWALGEKQDEDSRSRLATVLYTAAEALRIATALAYPVMPDATAKIWTQMGLSLIHI